MGKTSKLTDHTGYWLRLISNQVSHSFSRKLEATGVTVAEWVVMREMYGTDGSTSPGAVAELTGLSRGAVSKLISRLLEKGFVLRKEAKGDRRFQDIELTAKAKALVPKLANIADRNDHDFFSCLSLAEHRQLRAILEKMAAHHGIKNAPTE